MPVKQENNRSELSLRNSELTADRQTLVNRVSLV
jgi:hypothetical protein